MNKNNFSEEYFQFDEPEKIPLETAEENVLYDWDGGAIGEVK